MARSARFFGAIVVAVIAGLLGSGGVAAQETESFTLQPGGTATITFEAFCTNYGQNFPDQIEAPDALAQPELQKALAYIEEQGLAANAADALDAQYGLWRVIGAADSPQGGAIAANVVNAANTGIPAPSGTSLLDAVQAGQVTVSVASWEPIGQPVEIGDLTDHFYGRGTLRVENTSNQTLTLYHPIGALYAPTEVGDQTMAAYATEIEVQNPQTIEVTQTSQPTELPETSAGVGQTLLPILSSLTLGAIALGLRLKRRSIQRTDSREM
ncbi:MAG: hypothetical protein HC822_15305 [Oscillochloris sp.]|nr:hypothetical protein [Oscillochloris sp.]